MPYVSTHGAVHADDCSRILPDIDSARYVRELPDGLPAAGCDCRGS